MDNIGWVEERPIRGAAVTEYASASPAMLVVSLSASAGKIIKVISHMLHRDGSEKGNVQNGVINKLTLRVMKLNLR